MYVIIDLRYLFFFFKQKPAYELRISDWSSDVCSSDLPEPGALDLLVACPDLPELLEDRFLVLGRDPDAGVGHRHLQPPLPQRRSEERRVGKECVSTCRSRRSPSH